jgi:uroporphyrinogen-III synthase
MLEGLPLQGKRVVITRAAEQAGGLAAELEKLGAEVLFFPVVRYEEPMDPAPLNSALRKLAEFDWVLLTSQNVVRFLGLALAKTNAPPWPATVKIAAVGRATAEAAQAAGWHVEFVSARFQGLALAEELGSTLKGCKVLLPRSDRARPDLPEALRRTGAEVTEVVAYRTLALDTQDLPAARAIREGRVDVLTFASPSAFHAFYSALGADMAKQAARAGVIAAIGPVTARAIREKALAVGVEAAESTAEGLAQALAEYFLKQKATAGVRSDELSNPTPAKIAP